MNPNPSQQHVGLHDAVWCLQQEVTRPNAKDLKFKPTMLEKSGVDGVAMRCQNTLVSCFTYASHGDLV